uniref:E3 ubiquitin-protein ligase n=1 Tax=Arcella intermedia TaxID=1963864 RepID=A0A6B2KWI8_9EUKA
MDECCLICKKCYDNGNHNTTLKHHQATPIRLHQSSGCCDCGDPQAWAPEGFCALHRGNTDEDPAKGMDPTLLRMISTITATLLKILVASLCSLEDYELILSDITTEQMKSGVVAVIKNDDVHTFDDVTRQLVKVVKVTPKVANFIAIRTDALGAAAVYAGSVENCEGVCREMGEITLETLLKRNCKVLSVKTVNGLLDWFNSFLNLSDGIRRIVGLEFLKAIPSNTVPVNGETYQQKSMLVYDSLIESTKKKFHEVIFQFLKDSQLKTQFAIDFSHLYSKLIDYLSKGIVPEDKSILRVSVQLFTLPQTTPVLVLEHNLLDNMLSSLDKCISSAKLEDGTINMKNKMFKSSIPHYIITDLEFLFALEPVTDWMFKTREDLFSTFLKIFSSTQHAISTQRLTDVHIETENNHWIKVYNFVATFNDSVAFLLTAFTKQVKEYVKTKSSKAVDRVMFLSIKNVLEAFEKNIAGLNRWKSVKNSAGEFEIIQFVVDSEPVTFHLPSQRFLCHITKVLISEGITELPSFFLDTDLIQDLKKFAVTYLEMPLRLWVVQPQLKLDMWVRNGQLMYGQVGAYVEGRWRNTALKPDIGAMQLSVILMKDPNLLMTILMDRFKVNSFFDVNLKLEEPVAADSKLMAKSNIVLSEGLFYLLTFILNTRESIGVTTIEDDIRTFLIHCLWLGKQTFTNLSNAFDAQIIERPEFEKVLKEVGIVKKASGFQQGGYELKEQYQSYYSPYWTYYNFEEREKAWEAYHQYQDKEAKKQNKSLSEMSHLPIPSPIKLLPSFAPLLDIYSSVLLHEMVFTVFYRATCGIKGQCSSLLVDQSLHLIQLAIKDLAIISDEFFSMTLHFKKSEDINMISLLFALSKISDYARQHSAIQWIFESLSAKNHYLKSIINKFVHPEQLSSIKLSAEEEKEMRRKKALEARKRAMEKMNSKATTFSETLKSEVKTDVKPVEETEDEHNECILCHENHKDITKHPWGLIGYTQHTYLYNYPESIEERKNFVAQQKKLLGAAHLQTCGHHIHVDCFHKYYKTLESSILNEEHSHPPFDLEVGEFICPLCKSTADVIIPCVSPSFHKPVVSSVGFKDELVFLDPHPSLDEFHSDFKVLVDPIEAFINRLVCTTENEDFTKSTERDYLFFNAIKSLGSTLLSIEISKRVDLGDYIGANFSNLKTRTKETIKQFVNTLFTYALLHGYPRTPQIQKSITLLHNTIIAKSQPDEISSCLLTTNIFEQFLFRFISEPLVTCNLDASLMKSVFCELFQLLFLAQFIQSTIQLELSTEQIDISNSLDFQVFERYSSSWKTLHQQVIAELRLTPSAYPEGAKFRRVLRSCLPYVRCSTLLFHVMFDAKLPDIDVAECVTQEMEILLDGWGVKLENVLSTKEGGNYVSGWCNQLHHFDKLQKDPIDKDEALKKRWEEQLPPFHNALPFKLIDLPSNYSDVIAKFTSSNDNALCLLCGSLVRVVRTQSGKGECTTHSIQCGQGQGIFLILNQAIIVSLVKGNVFVLPTPYLDQYGEIPKSLKRGRQLTLNPDRFHSLHEMVVNQQLGLSEAIPLVAPRNSF